MHKYLIEKEGRYQGEEQVNGRLGVKRQKTSIQIEPIILIGLGGRGFLKSYLISLEFFLKKKMKRSK